MKRYKDTKYLITEDGQVWSELRNRFLKRTIHRGYYKVHTNFKNNIYVHRLVAETYLDNYNNFNQVNHIDGNKLNNHYTDWEWCTISHNTKHGCKLGLLVTKGEKNSCAILKEQDVLRIRYLYENTDITLSELAKQFKVSDSAIKGIVYRYNWTHI